MRKRINKAAGQQDCAAISGATSGNASGAQAERDAKPDVFAKAYERRCSLCGQLYMTDSPGARWTNAKGNHRREFEIDDVVQAVNALVETFPDLPNEDDDGGSRAGHEDC